MSDYKNSDQMAFPVQKSDEPGSLYAEKGLTKREHFAVLLMQGIIARCPQDVWRTASPDGVAMEALDHADALLIALERKP